MRDTTSADSPSRLAGDGTDSKRLTHNVLERKRRNDLKASYKLFREQIPELANQERAPSALILRSGTVYIQTLNTEDISLTRAVGGLRTENKGLVEHVEKLKKTWEMIQKRLAEKEQAAAGLVTAALLVTAQ